MTTTAVVFMVVAWSIVIGGCAVSMRRIFKK
ncbi:MAG: MetS family NSS transporter small subunit [Peptostreptococcaceae bacterium]